MCGNKDDDFFKNVSLFAYLHIWPRPRVSGGGKVMHFTICISLLPERLKTTMVTIGLVVVNTKVDNVILLTDDARRTTDDARRRIKTNDNRSPELDDLKLFAEVEYLL